MQPERHEGRREMTPHLYGNFLCSINQCYFNCCSIPFRAAFAGGEFLWGEVAAVGVRGCGEVVVRVACGAGRVLFLEGGGQGVRYGFACFCPDHSCFRHGCVTQSLAAQGREWCGSDLGVSQRKEGETGFMAMWGRAGLLTNACLETGDGKAKEARSRTGRASFLGYWYGNNDYLTRPLSNFSFTFTSMSSVMAARSYFGAHPHSSRAQVSSMLLGQLSAMACFTGSMS